ncbi:MAG: IS200/IS605 family transposase [Pirellulales bacterium]|nr:IS200/IS605 family transposase [Pirellulales bacterium]
MPQSLARMWNHLVFSTKERRAYLQNAEIRDELFHMLSHKVNEIGCTAMQSGGWVDHVHILFGLSRTIRICEVVEHIKTETSKWVKTRASDLQTFSWQQGYGVFSVSHSKLDDVLLYIRNQAEHHRRLTYQQEFRRICAKHDIEIDERYVWD